MVLEMSMTVMFHIISIMAGRASSSDPPPPSLAASCVFCAAAAAFCMASNCIPAPSIFAPIPWDQDPATSMAAMRYIAPTVLSICSPYRTSTSLAPSFVHCCLAPALSPSTYRLMRSRRAAASRTTRRRSNSINCDSVSLSLSSDPSASVCVTSLSRPTMSSKESFPKRNVKMRDGSTLSIATSVLSPLSPSFPSLLYTARRLSSLRT
mmetsp:Transcript_44243/g.94189  ORF Transcript_44243/g.94189 Transcript_44243/m.94189 type:complete len:208 (-) Transcript_44243:211-834(-)